MRLTLGAKAIKETNRRIPCELLRKVQVIYSGLLWSLSGELGLKPCIHESLHGLGYEEREARTVKPGLWLDKWLLTPGSPREARTQRLCVTPWGQTLHWPPSHWEQKPEPDQGQQGAPNVPLPLISWASSSTPAILTDFLQPHQGHSYLWAFALAVPSAWDTLPPNIPTAPSLDDAIIKLV